MTRDDVAARIAGAIALSDAVGQLRELIHAKADHVAFERLVDALDPIMRGEQENRATVFMLLAALLRQAIPADGSERVWLAAFVAEVSSLQPMQVTHDGPATLQ